MNEEGYEIREALNGVVLRNDDPLKIGRVKIRVAGLIEESAWAFPFGAPGGGSPGSGFYHPPKVGAEVTLLFAQGDPDVPLYTWGHWTAPGGHGKAPSFVQAGDVSASEAPLVNGYETERFKLVFDNRPGRESFEIVDKVSGDGVSYDGLTRSLQVQSTTAIVIKAIGAVQIDAPAITIAGRPVVPGAGPI